MIFPEIFEIAVGVGGQGGPGVMLTRDASGAWGYPASIGCPRAVSGCNSARNRGKSFFLLMTDSSVRDVINSPSQFAIGSSHLRRGQRRQRRHQHQGRQHHRLHQGSGVFAGVALSARM